MRMSKLSLTSEGRYLTPDERQQLLSYAAGLPQRLRYAEIVEAKEDGIATGVTEEMKRKYPNFAKFHDQAWGKCHRDVSLVVRYLTQAMVFEDMTSYEDKLLYWMRTILSASNFTPQFVRDCYTFLREKSKAALPADAFAAVEPYIDRTIDVLSDFPEPATPAV